MKLDTASILNLKPNIKPFKVFDGHGLYLYVSPNNTKFWRLKYRWLRKENTLSLGAFPKVSLAEARQLSEQARSLLAKGINPGEIAKQKKVAIEEEKDRQAEKIRFSLDNEWALSIRLGNKIMNLTSDETLDLWYFLEAIQHAIPRR